MSDPYSSLIYDDYTDFVADTGGPVMQLSRSWSTVGSVVATASGAGRFGIWSFAVTTPGVARYSTEQAACGPLSSLSWVYAQAVVGIAGPLSDGTTTYQVFVGFGDTNSSLNQVGVQANFLYDSQGVAAGGAASPYWQVWVRDGATVTTFPLDGAVHSGISTVAVLVGLVSWPSTNVYNMQISMVPGGAVVFTINGVVVATVPAPAASARTVGQFVGIYKSAGVSSRAVQVDYARLSMERVSLPTP